MVANDANLRALLREQGVRNKVGSCGSPEQEAEAPDHSLPTDMRSVTTREGDIEGGAWVFQTLTYPNHLQGSAHAYLAHV